MIIEPTIKANAGIKPFSNESIDTLIKEKKELNKLEKPIEPEVVEEKNAEEKVTTEVVEEEVPVKKNNKNRGGK